MSTWSTPTIPRVLDLFLANGVTTVRNIDGRPYNLEWRDRIARGEMRGPTIHTAGPILDGDPPLRDDNLAIGSADDARQAVRDQAAAGYDFVKIDTNLSGESYADVLETAADVGLPVAGHVPRGVAVDEMLVSGIRSIEHESELGIWSTPSLAGRPGDGLRRCRRPGSLGVVGDAASRPHGCRRLGACGGRRSNRLHLVSALQDAGACLLAGTDTPNPFVVPGCSLHDELANFEAAGFDRGRILALATRGAARFLETTGEVGTPWSEHGRWCPSTSERTPGDRKVAVINEVLARRHWPETDPLARRLTVEVSGRAFEAKIVGVVGAARARGFASLPRPEVFVPHAQGGGEGLTYLPTMGE